MAASSGSSKPGPRSSSSMAVRTAAAWSRVAKPTWRSSAHRFSVMSLSGLSLADLAVEVLPVRFAELSAEHLARRVPGQRLRPLDGGRALVVGQPPPAEGDQLIGCHLRAWPADDERQGGLAPALRGDADDRGLEDAGVFGQDSLDFAGDDVLAARD